MNPNFDELIAIFKYEVDAKAWIKDHDGVFHKYYIMETDRGFEVFYKI